MENGDVTFTTVSSVPCVRPVLTLNVRKESSRSKFGATEKNSDKHQVNEIYEKLLSYNHYKIKAMGDNVIIILSL